MKVFAFIATLMLLIFTVPSSASAQEKESAREQSTSLQSLLKNYFLIEDALVASNGSSAADAAQKMGLMLQTINPDQFEPAEKVIYSKVKSDLLEDAEHIAGTKDPGHQRDHFATLSKSVYALVKVSQVKTPVYYQRCPMASSGKGATWLSREKEIRNPYFGSQMMQCGSTIETLN